MLAGWVRDAEFADAAPNPARSKSTASVGLPGSVRRYSGDVPARAVLDELLRVGAVQRLADGRIELRTRAYVPCTATMRSCTSWVPMWPTWWPRSATTCNMAAATHASSAR